jgi:hypothetical protein
MLLAWSRAAARSDRVVIEVVAMVGVVAGERCAGALLLLMPALDLLLLIVLVVLPLMRPLM